MADSAVVGPTLRDVVAPTLERLLAHARIGEEQGLQARVLFDRLTGESLSLPAGGDRPRFSGICRDGTPWQFCATLGAGATSVRYLTEVGVPGSPLSDRLALSSERLDEVLGLLGYPNSSRVAKDAVFALAPRDVDLAAGVWVAVAYTAGDQCRLRLYANNGWGDLTERWLRLIRCLEAIGGAGFGQALRPHLSVLTEAFSPAGFAVTLPHEPTLCKLYLRPLGARWTECREVVHLVLGARGDAFLGTLEAALGCRLESLPGKALVLSVAGPATGGELDVKLDLCGHCVFPTDREARRTVRDLARGYGLDAAPYDRHLRELGAARRGWRDLHAFVGIGAQPSGATRINIYLKPGKPDAGARRVVREREQRALNRGIAALVGAIDDSGAWSDFTLPVGRSTTWVTAYVGNALHEASAHHAEPDPVARACRLAADKVDRWFRPGEGWGYHAGIEADADSTALCVLLQEWEGREAAPGRDALRRFERPEGGFGTFRRTDPANGWGLSHADVLPTVCRGLGRDKEGVDAVLALREPAGFWRSYWWETDLYATEACLRLLWVRGHRRVCQQSRRWLLERPFPMSAFEQALLLKALRVLRPDGAVRAAGARLVEALIGSQRSDGSWPGGALLRVTVATCLRPWEARGEAGRLYPDGGTITTATVVSALASAVGQLRLRAL